mmetsp:Transcript_12622/g.34879  ORF Transcript_12622/g.34879 Transcript_12622/m.34879 type:complete len:162 (-) Transcript_12622:178-663(-)
MVNLHKLLASQGFDIIAFPCNQFGQQESGSPEAILKDMEQFGIKFTFMSMVDVNGRDASPVYRFLKAQPQCAGDITWNYRTKCGGLHRARTREHAHLCSPALPTSSPFLHFNSTRTSTPLGCLRTRTQPDALPCTEHARTHTHTRAHTGLISVVSVVPSAS